MRKLIVIVLCLWASVTLYAQDGKKFSPEKFEADLQEFIKKEANLDAQEAARFFPLLKEMHKQQRAIYGRMMELGRSKPASEVACAEAIKHRDKCNLELRELEQTFHKRMLRVLPASKLYDAIRAESRFHRRMMRGTHGGFGGGFNGGGNGGFKGGFWPGGPGGPGGPGSPGGFNGMMPGKRN